MALRHLWQFSTCLFLSLAVFVGCAEDTSDCCDTFEAMLVELDACCQSNVGKPAYEWTGCCREGLQADFGPRPDCCARTLAAMKDMPACCLRSREGEPEECCRDHDLG